MLLNAILVFLLLLDDETCSLHTITVGTNLEYFTDSIIVTLVLPLLHDIATIVSTLLILAWETTNFARGKIVF